MTVPSRRRVAPRNNQGSADLAGIGSPLLWSSAQLLAATKTEDQLWEAGAATGPVKFRA
jgi:hypothetical protein